MTDVSGIVKDTQGNALAGLQVTIKYKLPLVGSGGGAAVGNTRVFTTTGTGLLEMDGLEPGYYNISISVPNSSASANPTILQEGDLTVLAQAEQTLESAISTTFGTITPTILQQALDAAAAAEASAARVDLGALDDAVAATEADAAQTALDRIATAADVVTSTGLLADTTAARDLAETYAGIDHPAATWAALAAISGLAGETGYVGPEDAGTHTDPIAAGTVPNEGVYTWAADGLGSAEAERTASTGLAVLQSQIDAVAADLATVSDGLDVTGTIGRAADPIAGSGLAAGTYVIADGIEGPGRIYQVRVQSIGAFPIKVRKFSQSGDVFTQVGSDTTITTVNGLATVAVDIDMDAGEKIGFYAAAGVVRFTSSGADSGGHYSTGTDSAGFTDASVTLTARLQISFDVEYQEVTATKQQAIELRSDASFGISKTAITGLGSIASRVSTAIEAQAATTSYGGTTFGGWAGVFILDGVPVGTPINALSFDRVYADATATTFNLKVYKRPDSFIGINAAPPASCVLISETDYTLAELGITAGAVDRPTATCELSVPFIKESGFHIAWSWEVRDASSARVGSSAGYGTDATASADERGYYLSSVASTTYTNISATQRIGAAVLQDVYSLAAGEPILGTVTATATVSGYDVAVSGFGSTATGNTVTFANTITLTAAATGKERIDKIMLNRLTGALSVVAGTERDEDVDPIEWQGSPTSGVAIAACSVTDSAVVAQVVSDFRGLVQIGKEGTYAYHVERNRGILSPVINKARRSVAINLGGYGDSITALQNGTPAYTANGTLRDRASESYLTNYPSDTMEKYGLGTTDTTNLYDTGDGIGKLHTRLGWNWAIKAALDDMAGSEVVTYLNYGIGGTNSTATGSNGLLPARIAEPLGDSLDVVVIGFGMNERGKTYTYANVRNMIEQFKAVGTICVVIGCPRPNGNQSVTAWQSTNNQLEAAAFDTGSAYISTQMIADDATLGGMGVPANVLASANEISGGNNHPGVFEHYVYEQAAAEQLGLH